MHPFRAAVEARDIDGMLDLLSEDVVFRSPVVFRPYQGRDAVGPVLCAVSQVFENFRYVREIGSREAADHALVFHASIGGRHVEGSDFIHVNEKGSITELAVMMRPLSATLALAEAMNARLGDIGDHSHDEDAASEPLADGKSGLPYIDEHRIRIAASRDLVWTALRRYADSSLGVAESHPLATLLGTEPLSGFEVAQDVPNQHLSMAGRHRFARYLLVFDLADVAGGKTLLSARTYAAFPGPHGRTYRALVIGTRGHVVAVKHMLRSIRRLSLELTNPVQA